MALVLIAGPFFFTGNGYAQQAPPLACKQYPEGAESEAKKKHGYDSYGSEALKECEELSLGKMSSLYNPSTGAHTSFSWEKYLNFSCREHCKENPSEQFNECYKNKKNVAKKCEALAFMMSSFGRDWKNEDHLRPDRSNNNNNRQISATATTTTKGQAATTSIGGSNLKCISDGIETIDYEACKDFENQLSLFEGVQQIGYATQSLIYSDKLLDSQLKNSSEKNAATGALKSTGDSLKLQEEMMEQRSAIEAGKLALAYKIYNSMPRKEEVLGKCKEFSNKSIQFAERETLSADECREYFDGRNNKTSLTLNQSQLEVMKSRLVQIATATGSNLLVAKLLGKRADDVQDAIAKIDAFKPADPFATAESDALSTLCKENPGRPECLSGSLERTFDTMNDNIITFGNGGTGTTFGTNSTPNAAILETGLGSPTNRDSVAPVGSVIKAAAQDNSFEKVAAATVSVAPPGGSGGGGGGLGGGGGGGLGGGGGPSPGGAAPSSAQGAIPARAPAYIGGGGFSVVGGFGINKKKDAAKNEENPFGKLFAKDEKGNGLVNFREPASKKVGNQSDNIFDMISKRYSSVNADKRLLEYELAK